LRRTVVSAVINDNNCLLLQGDDLMLPTILAIITIVIVLFLVYVATRPSEFRVVRSLAVSASPAVLFEQVNDLHRWQAWSPWAKLDPEMKVTYAGAEQGTGASYTWLGNKKVGEGKMVIEQSEPDSRIVIQLQFIKPFPATNTTEFSFKPEGNQTLVAWAMTGQKNFMMKFFGVLMNMDKMIGQDFEKGLAAMKTIAEDRK